MCHFISMISRWNCLKQRDKLLVRKFYLRSLSQAYKMTSLEELHTFFEAILVALSEYVGSNENEEELPSELRLRYLNALIKTIPAPEISDEINENTDRDETDKLEDQNTSDWFQWSANIYDNALRLAMNCTEGTAINACYNPDFAKIMKTRLIPYVVLWSGVMRLHFQIGEEIATSSSVEAAFADLKNRAFKNQLPMRADKFVYEHLDYLDGKIKLASYQKDILNVSEQNQATLNYSANSVETQTDLSINDCSYSSTINYNVQNINITEDIDKNIKIDTIVNNIDDLNNDNNNNNYNNNDNNDKNSTMIDTIVIDNENQLSCNIRENWRGLIRESPDEQCSIPKKRHKPSYLDKCPEWDYIKLARDQNIPLIRNGSVCKAVNVNNKVITIHETCAFDAVLHLVASGIASIKSYDDKIKFLENRTINLAVSILHAGKIMMNHYKERAKILLDLSLFSDALTIYTRRISKLNTNCNVAHLINYLFIDIPSCQKTIACPCGSSRTTKITELNVNVDILLCKGLQYMQEAIDNALAIMTKCRKCLNTVVENVEYGPHLFIDTTVFTDERYVKRDKTIIHSLETIATSIVLNSKKYILVGVIHYVKSSSTASGHYVTYARAGTYWYEYDDLKKKRIAVNINTNISPHLILYVTAEI